MGKDLKETIGSSFDNDLSDMQDPRETKEEMLKQLLGTEDLDVNDLDEEALDLIMQRLTGIGTIEESTKTIISVMKDLKADDANIIEALAVNLGMHMTEAQEIYEEHKLYG